MRFGAFSMFFTKNIMNVTGRPTREILNKFSFTNVVTCYNDICRCMASIYTVASRVTPSQTLNSCIQTVLFEV